MEIIDEEQFDDAFQDTDGDWDFEHENAMVIYTKIEQEYYDNINQYKSDIGCIVQSSLGMLFNTVM